VFSWFWSSKFCDADPFVWEFQAQFYAFSLPSLPLLVEWLNLSFEWIEKSMKYIIPQNQIFPISIDDVMG
jgi:hypothetical protein